jgi:hypothetical protein
VSQQRKHQTYGAHAQVGVGIVCGSLHARVAVSHRRCTPAGLATGFSACYSGLAKPSGAC